MIKKSYFKKIILSVIIIVMLLPFGISLGALFADTEKLTLSSLLTDYQEQEITEELDFLSDFDPESGDGGGLIEFDGWSVPDYKNNDNESLLLNSELPLYESIEAEVQENALKIVNLSSDDHFYYSGNKNLTYLGVFGASSEGYGLFFLTSKEGVLGAETTEIIIPAHAIYVLSFKVNIGHSGKDSGLNVRVIDENENIYSMSAIKNTSKNYKTYAFLIRGHELNEKTVKLQFLWGNIKKETDGIYTAEKELGYAVVDSIRLFSVNSEQYADLASESAHKQVDLFSSSAYQFIKNGYFNQVKNKKWKLEENTQIMDFLPEHWLQETTLTDEDHIVARYGVVNVSSSKLDNLGLINPGSPNPEISNNNNVLILYNGNNTEPQNAYQSITSTETTLQKNKYYEISFKFNTPALSDSADEENNSLNFYIKTSDNKVIYSREDMFSYDEWREDANEWTTFRLFIKTSDKDQKFKFVIKFGTEDKPKSGYAYVDEINLSLPKPSAGAMFNNTEEDKYVLKDGDEENTHLATGNISFSDLEKVDFSSEMVATTGGNRSLAIYDFTAPVIPTDTDEEDPEPSPVEEPTRNLNYLWYVIPSILLGVCTILGLVIFYGSKLKKKIKFPKKAKKSSYDRKKTLNKQAASQKSVSANTSSIEKQLKSVKSQITKLENNYKKTKSSPTALKEYVKKREKLQNEELRLKEKLDKVSSKKK